MAYPPLRLLQHEQEYEHATITGEGNVTETPITIAEAASWLRAGRITSVALTEAMLARAHAAQASLGAFNVITDETALAAARAADAAFAAGIDRGPLQGIPLGIKDLLATRDAPTTANSRVLDPAWGQRDDATVVRKLREAGAVLMGKLVLSEYAIGWPDPDTGFPIPRNPWNPAHFPGGSSSGTGVAVSAGLILGGLGSDTGGSVRGPASFCGISGLKVTFGLVSKEGAVPLGYTLDSIGPMTRTARDCALMMDVMAGYDPADPSSANVPLPSYADALTGSLAGVRVGLPSAYFFDNPEVDGEVRAAVLAGIEAMRAAGAKIVPIEIPYLAEGRTAQRVAMIAEAYAYHLPDLRARPHLYGKYTRLSFLQGAMYTAADYVQAQRMRSVMRDTCIAVMADVDVVVTPTSPKVAPRYDEYDPDSSVTAPSFTGYWNSTGMPALSVPCGFSNGLPIGMQIIGSPFTDDTVLAVGDAYQQITDWHLRLPDVPALKPQEVTA